MDKKFHAIRKTLENAASPPTVSYGPKQVLMWARHPLRTRRKSAGRPVCGLFKFMRVSPFLTAFAIWESDPLQSPGWEGIPTAKKHTF